VAGEKGFLNYRMQGDPACISEPKGNYGGGTDSLSEKRRIVVKKWLARRKESGAIGSG